MNIQRFLAPTSREAMAKARAAFGDSAVILSSRATASGFEVVATTEENLAHLPVGAASTATSQGAAGGGMTESRPASASSRFAQRVSSVEHDTETMAMSTLSFQDYVRERMLKRRKEELEAKQSTTGRPDQTTSAKRVNHALPVRPMSMESPSVAEVEARRSVRADQHSPIVTRDATPARAPEERGNVVSGWALPQVESAGAGVRAPDISNELSALKDMIEDRFNMLAWLGTSRNNPLQSNLMLKLIRSGYSPSLVRSLLERMPSESGPAEAVRWVLDVLARNLKTSESPTSLCDEGGVVALVGATGVGKTTTAAKLAAQCVKQYGPNSVGLITLDTYRVAGYEQLRAYGRMMGVVAHLAHDRAALKDLLGLLSGKRLVIIDTAGLGQKDSRVQDMMEMLDLPGVKKMLVLNASNHGDTMDDVMNGFNAKALSGVILSKVDEAVKIGPALDVLIRHQVVLRGVANGQRVPEDWMAPVATQLVRSSMGSEGKSAFDPAPSEVGFYFAQPNAGRIAGGALRV